MKVVIDSRALTRDVGSGVGWYSRQLIESLVKYTDLKVWAWYNAVKKDSLREILPTFDLPVQSLKITRWPNKLLKTVWSLPLFPFLPLDLVVGQADVFHAPSPIYGLPPARKIKRVVTIHDLTFLTHPETHSESDLKMKDTIKQTAEQADAVIAVSKNTKKDLVELLGVPPEKIHVVYEAPREIFGRIEDRGWRVEGRNRGWRVENRLVEMGIKKPYFLYVGNIEPRKNLVRLIKAFEQFQSSNNLTIHSNSPTLQLSNYQLVLAGGKAWKSDEIMVAIKNSPAHDKITLTGYLTDEDLVILYNNAHALFYVPLYEGFGLPVLEAMACGCPVVTSKSSSLPEVGGSAAQYVDPENVDAITQKMVEAVGWTQEAKSKKQKAGLEWVKNFSWQKVAQETKEVYQKILTA